MAEIDVPEAKIADPQRAFSDTEFVHLPDVPVFAEHETVTRDGKKRKFSRAELEAIAERCNRRIRETGDYAALTLGHTPSPEAQAKGVEQPELVGFAGPFKIGRLPNQERFAILADFHVYRDDLARVKKHPRRSPELWLEDRYEEMFLDPIALLGAEAPRLDMGLLYSAQRHGRLVEKYAAAGPAAASTFVPSHGDKTDYMGKNCYAADDDSQPTSKPQGAGMLTPEDVKQVVDAIYATEPFQFLMSQFQASGAASTSASADGAAAPAGGEPTPPPAGPPDAGAPPAAPPAAGPPGNGAPPPNHAPDEEPEKMEGTMGAPQRRYNAGEADVGLEDTSNVSGGGTEKFSKQFKQLQNELNVERGKRVDAERLQALTNLRWQGYAIDPEKVLNICRYGKMDDEQFTAHIEFIEENVKHCPVEVGLPTFAEAINGAPGPGRKAGAEQYSMASSEKAMQICNRMVDKGERPDYAEILADVKAGKR